MSFQNHSPFNAPVLLIDDDVNFCQLVSSCGQEMSLPVDCYTSLYDVGSMAKVNQYEVILLDFYVGKETAVQISDYLASFCQVPVMVISAVPIDPIARKKFPKIVKDFAVKSIGPEEILLRCKALSAAKQKNLWSECLTLREWVETSSD